ncbi:hypothetical protein F5879DRAFT_991955 [Lentinula edodes]|nr:hypothetical protein F5879DRAFT_991955 [Lentinula edodes]
MQSRLSGMSLYLKICFIVILFVAHVVALPVSGSELIHRANQAGPADPLDNLVLGDPQSAWKIIIVFFFPLKVTPKVYKEAIAISIHNRIDDGTEIATRYQSFSLPQITSLLPPGTSHEGDVSLKLTWDGPNHIFESRGKITANGRPSEATTINVEFSFPASDAGIGIRRSGVPEKARFTIRLPLT